MWRNETRPFVHRRPLIRIAQRPASGDRSALDRPRGQQAARNIRARKHLRGRPFGLIKRGQYSIEVCAANWTSCPFVSSRAIYSPLAVDNLSIWFLSHLNLWPYLHFRPRLHRSVGFWGRSIRSADQIDRTRQREICRIAGVAFIPCNRTISIDRGPPRRRERRAGQLRGDFLVSIISIASRATIGLFHGAISSIRKNIEEPDGRNSFRTGSRAGVDATTRRISFCASATFVFTTSPIALTRNERGMRVDAPSRTGRTRRFRPALAKPFPTDASHLRKVLAPVPPAHLPAYRRFPESPLDTFHRPYTASKSESSPVLSPRGSVRRSK